jgi:uncharacterized protein DUF2092
MTLASFFARLHPDDRAPVERAMRQSIEERGGYSASFYARRERRSWRISLPASARCCSSWPKALAIIKGASERQAAAKTMSFTARVGYESPSCLGPAPVYMSRYDVTMQRPDKLRVLSPGDGPPSDFYYDGKTMVAFAPAQKLVASASAPPTIDAIRHGSGAEDKLPRRLRALFRQDPSQLRHEMELSNRQLDVPVAADAFSPPPAAKEAQPIAFSRPEAAQTAPVGAVPSTTHPQPWVRKRT